MKQYLVDIFSRKLTSNVCDISSLVGTNAVNCSINNENPYYVILKGFPRLISKLTQLLGRLC